MPTSRFGEDTVDTHPRDAEGLGDGGRTMPDSPHLPHLLDRHRGFAALVDPLGFYRFDPCLLPLTDEPAFHLRHHPQHGHEDWPRLPPSLPALAAGLLGTDDLAPFFPKPRFLQ